MIKNRNETSAAMDKALKNLEQAKARYEAERKKENEKRRKAQNHHKYLMGGIVAKYFPECYQYEEKELNVILSAALASAECRQAVENVKRMEKNADDIYNKFRVKENANKLINALLAHLVEHLTLNQGVQGSSP